MSTANKNDQLLQTTEVDLASWYLISSRLSVWSKELRHI